MIINRPEGNKLTGFYLGRVVKHLDDGRYKVFIPGVYSDKYKASSDFLPPAVIANDVFNGDSEGGGQISYINNGTVVYCIFSNGDQNYPIIIATAPGGSNFTKIHNLQYFSEITVDEGAELDYKNKDPVSVSKRGKTMTRQNAGGQIQMVAQRNMTNSTDSIEQTYSHSMHMLNTMYSQGRITDKNYFVFSNNPDDVFNSEIRYRQIVNRQTDGDDEWFKDHFNDDDEEGFTCIGISCVIAPVSDEAYLVGRKIDCPKAGIQNPVSWNRQLYSSWGGQSHTMPCYIRNNGVIKNIYIKCDGVKKYVDFAAFTGAGLYICNGEQYGFIPQYWDKHFQGSYPAMCPQKVIPPPVLKDATAYNINIYPLDPYRVSSSQTLSENGANILSVLDQKDEYERYTHDLGNGIVSSYAFKQNGEYGAVQRAIYDYYRQYKAEDINALSTREEASRYSYISADNKMQTTELCSIHSMSSDIYRCENLTASWAAPDSVTRASYEKGDRSDIGISNYSNIYWREKYLSPDDNNSHISSFETFTRNEHCPIRGIITSFMTENISSDLNLGCSEITKLSVYNVPSDLIKNLNTIKTELGLETHLLSCWNKEEGTEDFVSSYTLAKPTFAVKTWDLQSFKGQSLTAAIQDYSSTNDILKKTTVNNVSNGTTTLESYDAKNGNITINISNGGVKASIMFDKDGNINIFGTTKLNITIGDKTPAQLDMLADGSITLTSPTNKIELAGDTHITGTLKVTSDIYSEGADVHSDKITLNTHTHPVHDTFTGGGTSDVGQ